jgi:hypothetical protein
MARVCWRLGLGTIAKDHFVCRFGNVGRPCAEGLETISLVGMGGQIGEYGTGGRDGTIRDYIYGCFRRWIVDCGRIACE